LDCKLQSIFALHRGSLPLQQVYDGCGTEPVAKIPGTRLALNKRPGTIRSNVRSLRMGIKDCLENTGDDHYSTTEWNRGCHCPCGETVRTYSNAARTTRRSRSSEGGLELRKAAPQMVLSNQ